MKAASKQVGTVPHTRKGASDAETHSDIHPASLSIALHFHLRFNRHIDDRSASRLAVVFLYRNRAFVDPALKTAVCLDEYQRTNRYALKSKARRSAQLRLLAS